MSDRSAPRPAEPLDRAERIVLAELAQVLEDDDPTLAAELTAVTDRPRATAGVEVSRAPARRGRGLLEGLLVVLGMVVLFGVVVLAATFWGLVGIVAVAATCVAVVVAMALMGDPFPKRH